ncbi:NmrA-like family protein [Pleurostoma richardsiae]|uniref:NmrA-like family protein n=1 Tax=Pleurostoma richardsiae TaxID=41990 RepID=A0AA38RDP8_9PEZI|nr:NmrA-like family protein [Pleurostoma richardsiae]
MSRSVLVCGATGKQGGAVIRCLIKENADLEILAVTRDASSASAQKLLELSTRVKLVQGNLADPSKLLETAQAAASTPVWGVFSVQVPMGFGQGGGGELGQGKALVDASLNAGVKLFVYTSVDRGGESSSESPTDIPHFRSKHLIEQHLMNSTRNAGGNMDWVILRPVAFMENFTDDFLGRAFLTAWRQAVKDKPLQLVAVSDIGFFGAQAFLYPEQYRGRGISLAGDEMTLDQLAKVFKEETGKDVQFTNSIVGSLLMWAVKDFGRMFKWFYDVGYGADIKTLREMHPGLKDFRTWLRQESQFSKLTKSQS